MPSMPILFLLKSSFSIFVGIELSIFLALSLLIHLVFRTSTDSSFEFSLCFKATLTIDAYY